MVGLLVFSTVLIVAVLVSDLAHRSVLSTAVLFLLAGFVAAASGVLVIQAGNPIVSRLALVALFSVLFTDGMRAGISDLRGAWRLPGRLLVLGLPLTLAANACLAWALTPLSWTQSFLVGAALSPTDPVFAAAIVGRPDVPGRVRHLLNVESGLNDGLALPGVIVLLAAAAGRSTSADTIFVDLSLGVAVGVVIPLAVVILRRIPGVAATTRYRPLAAVGIALTVLAVSELSGANPFLAAFGAGATLASVAPALRKAFGEFGELVTELLKLAALLVFGALLTVPLFWGLGLGGWAFAVLALVAVRPVTVVAALAGTGVRGRELLTVAWFGPKGFASVVYGLLILNAGIAQSGQMFAHSSTDALVARTFERARAAERARGEEGPLER
jgi:NhaP-type Na+/H+ or K+/H+ antiporter